MPGISCRPNPSAPQRARDESGFALVEVMVSAVLLIVLALSTMAVLDRSQSSSSNTRSRAVAAQLAQTEQDAIRQMPMSALAGGYNPGTVVKTIGNIKYNVTSSAHWVQDSGGAVTCSTTAGRVEYLSTTTSVTWSGMGSIKPVVADGVVSPGVAALGANKGALTVLLTRADGTGTGGITVSVGGQSAVTDDTGCAVIGNLDAGPATLTYNTAGYVDEDSKTLVSKAVTIGAGSIAQSTGYYDNPGTLAINLVSDGQGGNGTWTGSEGTSPGGKVSIDHANRSKPSVFKVDVDSVTKNSASVPLFPFESPYKAYVGECSGNDPSNKLYPDNPGAGGGLVTRGNTTTTNLVMRTATVTFTGTGTTNTAKVYIIAEKSDGKSNVMNVAECSTKYGPWTTTTGSLKVSLPTGVWRVCVNFKQSSSSNNWAQKKTVVGNPVDDDPLIVTPSSVTAPYAAFLETKIARPTSFSGGESACT